MPTYYNPKNGPVYLEDGSSIGGDERRDLDKSDRLQELVDGGYLVELKTTPKKSKESATSEQQKESEK